jgi:hypothetical protein
MTFYLILLALACVMGGFFALCGLLISWCSKRLARRALKKRLECYWSTGIDRF